MPNTECNFVSLERLTTLITAPQSYSLKDQGYNKDENFEKGQFLNNY